MSEELKETTGHESYITEAEARVVLESGVTAAKIDDFEERIVALENGGGVTIDDTVVEGSTHAVSGGAVYTTLTAKQDALSESQLAAANSGITSDKVATYDGYADNLGTKVVANDSTATASESLSILTVAGTSYSVGGSDNAWTTDNLRFTFDEEAGTVSITVVKSDGTTESGTVSTTE